MTCQPLPASSSGSKDKQPAVNGQPSAGSAAQSTARRSQGKLVFGSNSGRPTSKVRYFLQFLTF